MSPDPHLSDFYRFRSIRYLLDEEYNELENQEIYFADPHQLNDPMEGFKDILWKGDEVVWGNFFKHFLLCLQRVCMVFCICGDQHKLNGSDIPVFANTKEFPSDEFNKMFQEIYAKVAKEASIQRMVEGLSKRKTAIRREELVSYLRVLNTIAVDIIFRVFETQKLIQKHQINDQKRKAPELDKLIQLTHQMEDEQNDSDQMLKVLFSASEAIHSQMALINYNNTDDTTLSRNRFFLLSEFSSVFVRGLEKIVYPDWYAASFMAECKNSALWGHYGDGHKGVCLIFGASTKNGKPVIQLTGINGWGASGSLTGLREHEFFPIKYRKQFVEIDFFKSLGRFTRPILEECWYTDEEGQRSSCAEDIFANEDGWRKAYWDKFHQGITTKLEDWSYEKEYRLVLSSPFDEFTESKHRKLKYNFKDLKGIIFGINTPLDDKLEIMRIIDKKCQKENCEDFKFYQACYAPQNGNIDFHEMNLLTSSQPTSN